MSGLLMKDFYLIMANKKMYAVFALIAICFASIGKGESATMAVTYFTMILGMSVLSTITYDEYDHSIVHLMTLPIQRKDYAIEKCVFSFISLLCSWMIGLTMITATLWIKGVAIEWNSWLLSNMTILFIMSLLVAIMIPIQIKFGGENGKMVVIGVILVTFMVAFGISQLLVYLKIDLEAIFHHIERLMTETNVVLLVSVGLMGMVSIFVLSGLISYRIVRKKEY
ncbi:MAG: ABC-2 transporter permease [Lachnospiraceae bacterium]|jgi:ABC-2 type transport system permease protein|nr:ABC-2 transporter permease [Lachnospiraceae bacterium]